MTAREQYIQQLTDQLASLSSKERANAVEFYNEYIEDAGFTTVKEIVDQLGSPEQLSHEIITKTSDDQSVPADSPLSQENNRRLKKVLYATLVVVLAMILIPLAIELIGIAIGIIGAVLGIGIAAFGTAASLFTSDLWAAIFYLGGGIILLGILIIVIVLVIWAGKWLVGGCKQLVHYLKLKFKEVA